MTIRNALAALTSGLALAACNGAETCPTAAAAAEAGQDMSTACTMPAQDQVSVAVRLCEACSHTAPSCEADLAAADATHEIFLDTKWEVCTDDSSCSTPACAFATCRFTVPEGSYTVHTLAEGGGTQIFTLDLTGGAPVCSSYI